jgi:hypothetical protein
MGIPEPLLGGRAFERTERLLALQAPSIWTGGIAVVAPKEADPLAALDRKGDVLAYQPDAFAAMNRALRLGLIHTV